MARWCLRNDFALNDDWNTGCTDEWGTHHSCEGCPHHHHVTTQTKKVQPHKVRPIIRRHNTKVANTFLRNGILYYVILNPRRGHVYDNGLVLCEGCNKVLVKKEVKYCSKCRKLKETKRRIVWHSK